MTGKRKRIDVPTTTRDSKKPTREPATDPRKDLAKARVNATAAQVKADGPSKPVSVPPSELENESLLHVQIVTGSYERVLHGISASIPRQLLQTQPDLASAKATSQTEGKDVAFSDTFLFAAHASSIRCLAVSPPTESDKRFLATGSSDERINVYSVSTAPPKVTGKASLPSLIGNTITENSRNRSLGSLIHHDRAITCLEFPAKGKLFSSAEDNTIAISRTRDWTVLSSIKAPIPKAQGRPSGDTAGPGETPAGVNNFAIHPSQKLMLSVSRGERCLRLWNLMTGKKAGVLNFDRGLLGQTGEGKYSSGEGRRVLWDETGESYVVGFERGAAVFGIDSKPKGVVRPSPLTKLHQLRMLQLGGAEKEVLAASTEDGRILFYDLQSPKPTGNVQDKLPAYSCLAQLGGRAAGVDGRIKDFEILRLEIKSGKTASILLVVTASSDGAIRLWSMPDDAATLSQVSDSVSEQVKGAGSTARQVGSLIGTLETGNRITCLGAFVMDGKVGEDATNGQDDTLVGAEEHGDPSASEESE